MRQTKSILSLLAGALFLLPVLDTFAGSPLTERQAITALMKQIEKDKLYADWTQLSCLSFLTEEEAKNHFDIGIHEKHGGSCPGDPATFPIVDRFRVSRETGKIQWFDVMDELQPYNSVLKERGAKKK